MSMEEFDRRKRGVDHDILIEIRNDLKHLCMTFKEHTSKDDEYFKALNKEISNIKLDKARLIGLAVGIGVMSNIGLKAIEWMLGK